LSLITCTNRKNPRMKSRQTRDEARLLRVQMFQDDALVVAQVVELLIVGSAVEVRGIDVFGQRLIAKALLGKCGGVFSETLGTAWPRGSDGAVADGLDHVAAGLDVQTWWLEIRQGREAVGVVGCVGTNAHGIVRIGASCGAFIAQRHLGHSRALAKAAIERKSAFPVCFEGFVDRADDEAGRDRARWFASRCKGVSDEHDVGAHFEWNEVIRRIKASRGIVVPVVVVFVGVVLVLGQASLNGDEIERRFANDREYRAPSLSLPKQRRDSERADRNDVHGRWILVERLG
jgi:hypothetical protein